jgi:hypothetical protein
MHTRNPPRTPFLAGLLIITSISPLLSSLTNTPIPTLQTSYVTAPITAFSYLFIGIGLLITFEESLRIEHSCITTTGYITASLHTALTTLLLGHVVTPVDAGVARTGWCTRGEYGQ